jgi:hypothetical protein
MSLMGEYLQKDQVACVKNILSMSLPACDVCPRRAPNLLPDPTAQVPQPGQLVKTSRNLDKVTEAMYKPARSYGQDLTPLLVAQNLALMQNFLQERQ